MEILKGDHFLMKTLEPAQFLILSEISMVSLLSIKVFRKKCLISPLGYISMPVIRRFPLQILVTVFGGIWILNSICLTNPQQQTCIYHVNVVMIQSCENTIVII